MDAQTLFSIVSKWPEEAVPTRFRSWRVDPDWYGPKGPTRGLDEAEAVMLFESAGLRWLLSRPSPFLYMEIDARPPSIDIHLVQEGGGETEGRPATCASAPTLIEAISQAITSANQGKGT